MIDHGRAVQYLAHAAPLVTTAPATVPDVSSWMPTAPVRVVRRPRTTALLVTALTMLPIVVPPTPTGDGGGTWYEEVRHYQGLAEPLNITADSAPNIQLPLNFPDWIARPRPAAPWAPYQPPFGVEYPIPVQSWLGYGPDQLHPKPTRAHLPQRTTTFDPIENPPAPELSWGAAYPDRLDPRPRLRTARQQVSAQNLDPIATVLADAPNGWDPQYPDWLLHRRLRVALIPAQARWPLPLADPGSAPAGGSDVIEPLRVLQYQALTAPLVVPAVADSPELAWAPVYPDAVIRRHLPVALFRVSALTVDPIENPATPDLVWLPHYPDGILRPTLRVALQANPSITGTITSAATDLGDPRWLAVAPAWIARRPVPVDTRTQRTDPLAPAFPVAHLGWEPQYPDYLWRRALRTAAHQVFAANLVPILTVDPESLRFLPRFADLIARGRFLAAWQQAFAANLDPLAEAALVPLSWEPKFPTTLDRRYLWPAHAQVLAEAAPVVEVTIQTAPWHPTYPDRLARRPGPVLAPLPDLRLDGPALGDDHTCVELVGWDVTQAGLLLLIVTQAGKHAPDVTQAGTDPEIC